VIAVFFRERKKKNGSPALSCRRRCGDLAACYSGSCYSKKALLEKALFGRSAQEDFGEESWRGDHWQKLTGGYSQQRLAD